MISNTAAWLSTPKSYPFEVKAAPLPTPGENEILVRNRAVAVNLIDSMVQNNAFHPVDYPGILGQDLAGEVAVVGPNVRRFIEGDRVVGHSTVYGSEQARDGAFQEYTILRTNMASEIPDDVSFEAAAVLPLALSTAASALFQKEDLNLQLPTEPARGATGKTLLVWGGSSSVGSNAIQLAVAAGYEVITTASAHNYDYVRKLGASQCFDYHNPTIIEDVAKSLHGKDFVGAFDSIGDGTANATAKVVQQCESNRVVVTVKMVPSKVPDGVIVKHVRGDGLRNHGLSKTIYEDFLPKALRARSFVPAPDPLIVGRGLEYVQEALDLYVKGVSAKKVVVLL